MALVRFLYEAERHPLLWTVLALVLGLLPGAMTLLLPALPTSVAVLLLVPSVVLFGWLWRLSVSLPLVWTLAVFSHMPLPPQDIFVWASIIGAGLLLSVLASISTSLCRASKRAEEIARHDFLTGLLNGYGFSEMLAAERNRAIRFRQPLTVAYIDCDNFKKLNDTRGHSEGDRLLIALAEQLKQSLRNYDSVSRLGGDEFGVILPNTDTAIAKLVIGRLIEAVDVLMESNNWPVTLSVGSVTFEGVYPNIETSLALADQQMYAVKNHEKGGVHYCEVIDGEVRPADGEELARRSEMPVPTDTLPDLADQRPDEVQTSN